MGKTNLLEAISSISSSKSMRKAQLKEMILHGENEWGLEVDLFNRHVKNVTITANRSKKSTKIDGKAASRREILKTIQIEWLTPDMDFLLNQSTKSIRDFLDRMIFGFFQDKIPHLMRYERARKERIALLAQNNFDHLWLDKLEEEMATNGGEWTQARRQFIQLLNNQHLHSTLPKAFIALKEEPQDIKSYYLNELKLSRNKDAVTSITSVGPHRAKFMIESDKIHSTGEQKAAIISLLLENASLKKLHEKEPILLLDEILSHMDSDFQLKIIKSLESFQTWVTCTNFPNKKLGKQFTCENGMLFEDNDV